jgi:hypothetical protein
MQKWVRQLITDTISAIPLDNRFDVVVSAAICDALDRANVFAEPPIKGIGGHEHSWMQSGSHVSEFSCADCGAVARRLVEDAD